MRITLELAKEYLKNSKVYVESSRKSKLIQEKLKEIGYPARNNSVEETVQRSPYFLIGIPEIGTVACNDIEAFESCTCKQLEADDIIGIEIIDCPKFKVGDKVIKKGPKSLGIIKEYNSNLDHPYKLDDNYWYREQDLEKYQEGRVFKPGDIVYSNHDGQIHFITGVSEFIYELDNGSAKYSPRFLELLENIDKPRFRVGDVVRTHFVGERGKIIGIRRADNEYGYEYRLASGNYYKENVLEKDE